jgi:hypothetical protein
MNTATIAAPSNVTPFIQNLKMQQQKQQTAKEAIAANVQALIKQLEQGHSEGLTAYLIAWADFTTTHSGTSLRLPASGQTQLALLGCMRGTSLAAR